MRVLHQRRVQQAVWLAGALAVSVLVPLGEGWAQSVHEGAGSGRDVGQDQVAPHVVAAEGGRQPVERVSADGVGDQQGAAGGGGQGHGGLERVLDRAFGRVNSALAGVLFRDVSWGVFKWRQVDATGKPMVDGQGEAVMTGPEVPFVIAVLVLGSILFTFYYGWINVRGFKHSIDVIRGKYDDPNDRGEISHFRALTSALSATVGLGNIAGVALAVTLGGPGAVFWMMLLAVFGMTAKFSECTLAQVYRRFNRDGSVSGGPMYYLRMGLAEKGPALAVLGRLLAVIYAVMCIGGSLGGGNMFQANQSFEAFSSLPFIDGDNLWTARTFGIMMATCVALVILGGITRIGAATSKIVPLMCGMYVAASVVVVGYHITAIPAVVAMIFREAFHGQAVYGGFVGVMVWGFKRSAFSNEAGLGSAAIAHSAAKTNEPVREGIVAMIGPFIDTIVICFMTAMVVLVTGAYKNADAQGAAVTTFAFRSVPVVGEWFEDVLIVCIILFAYSTMISWCYYGERAWSYLFGYRSLVVYRVIFIVFVFIGSVMKLGAVLDFSDLMILCMAFPNIIGSLFLISAVRARLKDYWGRYTSGQMHPHAVTAGRGGRSAGKSFEI